MLRLMSIGLGGLIGLAFASFGLVDFSEGIAVSGGNEWTPLVCLLGLVSGGLAGSTRFFRRHIARQIGLLTGLVLGLWLRDAMSLHDLFGPRAIPVHDFSPYTPPSTPALLAIVAGCTLLGALIGHVLARGFIGRPKADRDSQA
jgi:hypothetical protein